jgi:hypothetical protein
LLRASADVEQVRRKQAVLAKRSVVKKIEELPFQSTGVIARLDQDQAGR